MTGTTDSTTGPAANLDRMMRLACLATDQAKAGPIRGFAETCVMIEHAISDAMEVLSTASRDACVYDDYCAYCSTSDHRWFDCPRQPVES